MQPEHAAVPDTAPVVPGFVDRLGDRVQLTDRETGRVEVLRLRPELTASPLFEAGVKRRANQLTGFLHPNYARVRRVGRLPSPDGRLVIVSDAVDGWRLSEVLEAAAPCGVAFNPDAVLFLLRQLLGAVADLHEVALGVSHGALGTERLVVTADGRLVITESVLGAALWHLPPMSPDRLWRDLRLAVAAREAQPFGRLTDLRQIGLVALSLALGRQLRRDEYPGRLAGLLEEWKPAPAGLGAEEFRPAIRGWLRRVLSLTDDLMPWSVAEARRELDRVVESDGRYAFAPEGLSVLLGAVGAYYAGAGEVPAPIDAQAARLQAHETSEAASAVEPAPAGDVAASDRDVRQPAPDASRPASEVPDVVLDDSSWPEPVVRPAGDQLVDSREEPPVETGLTSMCAEPPSPPHAVEDLAPPGREANALPAPPLAVPIGAMNVEPIGAYSPRPLLGVHVAEDPMDPVAAPSGRRTLTLVAVAAAALVIVALGGYTLVRPSSVGAAAARRASPPQPTAAAETRSPTATPSGASALPASTQPTPSAPRVPDPLPLPPVAAPRQPAPIGTIEVVSPVPLNVSEAGRALGASGTPIQVPAGRHTLEVGREDLGYRAVQVVDVQPGRPVRIEPPLPSGVANLNATPWAEVWIDGRKVGETPLGGLQLTIGSHEVQFRHPEFGNQTRTLVVTTGSVALLSVDLKK
jgi:hypothetical protein